jgi:phage-related protein
MALQTFIPPLPPSEGTSVTQKLKLLKAEFGDGYTQITRDGINHIRKSIRLTWDLLHPDDAAIITDFLTFHGGDTPFFYTPSDELTPIKWTCSDWSDTRGQGGYRAISATFEQSFDNRTDTNVIAAIGIAIGSTSTTSGAGGRTQASVASSGTGSFLSRGTALAQGRRVVGAAAASTGTGSSSVVGAAV